MKKILFLIVILFSIACQKEEIVTPEIVDISSYNKNEFGEFRKELIVYDDSGQNSILLLIHSDFSGIIEHYL